LRLDQIFYDENKTTAVCLFTARNRRTPWIIPLHEALNDKDVINELCPIDAFIIGVISCAARKHLNINLIKISKLKRYINTCAPYKSKGLYIAKRHFLASTTQFVLKTCHSKKELKMDTSQLLKDVGLISLLTPTDALAVAFDINKTNLQNLCGNYA